MNKQEYLLTTRMEEAGEVVKATSKCLRFTTHHEYLNDGVSNFDRLRTEVRDLITMLILFEDASGLQFDLDYSAAKAQKSDKYMAISREMGTLNE
jgi:hypothetical protein